MQCTGIGVQGAGGLCAGVVLPGGGRARMGAQARGVACLLLPAAAIAGRRVQACPGGAQSGGSQPLSACALACHTRPHCTSHCDPRAMCRHASAAPLCCSHTAGRQARLEHFFGCTPWVMCWPPKLGGCGSREGFRREYGGGTAWRPLFVGHNGRSLLARLVALLFVCCWLAPVGPAPLGPYVCCCT